MCELEPPVTWILVGMHAVYTEKIEYLDENIVIDARDNCPL
jgi:hypothetical protein